MPTFLSGMQNLYKKYDTETPFDYTFMDDAFNQQYKAEDRLASIFSVFTYITILLATLGLFGLAAFTIEQSHQRNRYQKSIGCKCSLHQLTVITRFFEAGDIIRNHRVACSLVGHA